MGHWRRRSSFTHAWRHRGFRLHARRADGAGVRSTDDCRIADHDETATINTVEVLSISKPMKKIALLLFALMCCGIAVNGQTRSGGRATVKTQKSEAARRRAVKLDAPPNGLFSPAIVSGDLVFTSGQIGVDPKTGQNGFVSLFRLAGPRH